MNNTPSSRLVLIALAGAIALVGCASTPTASAPTPAEVVGGMQSSDAKSQECITASIVGGLVGGMIAEGTNTAKGAAAGAGIAMLGCVAVKANAREAKEKEAAGSSKPPTSTTHPAISTSPTGVKSLD